MGYISLLIYLLTCLIYLRHIPTVSQPEAQLFQKDRAMHHVS